MQGLNLIIFLFAGLVKEELNKGTFKRFKNTRAQVFSMQVTEEQYNKIQTMLKTMYTNKEKYKFNFRGLFLVALKKSLPRENYFYCAEFIKHILHTVDIDVTPLPEIIRPEDFKKLDSLKLIYDGFLRDYAI